MDRFDVIQFADLSGPNGGEWVRIGGGSFGVVFKGEYLGTPVAIKEVLPNNTYDVEKYFERECVLMKEARHPNIVQYIGLTKSPGPDGRIYIISEFVGGNVRNYIADKRKPFPWRLRISFAMDIARAVAYLHARNCMHRDLKGENLLITENERIKVCDFGFARIAARNEEEMRRISYCGTDGYMSPEILLGVDFSLPSDIFSLGVIFCEIASRHLVDSNVFKRQMPEFGLDEAEVREMASEGCPSRLIQLALDCVEIDPARRPDMREVVRRLREIELEIIERDEKASKGTLKAVGSIRGSSVQAIMGSKGGKGKKTARPQAPRLPSFNGQVALPSHLEETTNRRNQNSSDSGESVGSSDDEELDAALAQLEQVHIADPSGTLPKESTFKVSGHGNPWWWDDNRSTLPSIRASWLPHQDSTRASTSSRPALPSLLRENKWTSQSAVAGAHPLHQDSENGTVVGDAEYSTSVVKPSRIAGSGRGSAFRDSLSRLNAGAQPDEEKAGASLMTIKTVRQGDVSGDSPPVTQEVERAGPASYMTARSAFADGQGHGADPSIAVATLASSIYSPAPLYHRFTLVKNGTRRPSLSKLKSASGCEVRHQDPLLDAQSKSIPATASMLPPALMLTSALAKCHVCNKRIGWKPFLDCDDCPYKCHVACGDLAEPSCQELSIPGEPFSPAPKSLGVRGSNNPVVTAYNADTRGLRSSESALASPKQANNSFESETSSSSSPEREPKEKKGGAAARLKRWSKSPPIVKA
ncbi:unnamed protein product [Sympodiomycopsis kandeliae]